MARRADFRRVPAEAVGRSSSSRSRAQASRPRGSYRASASLTASAVALVPGSAVLVGGDPGIGKSTLLLQAAASLAREAEVVYVSGEEAIEQVRLRASRLGLAKAPVRLAT